jgi:hypothetical protein
MASRIIADFSWSPVSVALSFTFIGTYPYTTQADSISRSSDSRYAAYTTPNNTLLTFTATASIPAGLTAVEYKWNFGDGTVGYGSSVGHTYTISSPQTMATLIVTDNLGRQSSIGRLLNLRQASPIVIAQNLSVS